jgi:hypothetical protein
MNSRTYPRYPRLSWVQSVCSSRVHSTIINGGFIHRFTLRNNVAPSCVLIRDTLSTRIPDEPGVLNVATPEPIKKKYATSDRAAWMQAYKCSSMDGQLDSTPYHYSRLRCLWQFLSTSTVTVRTGHSVPLG